MMSAELQKEASSAASPLTLVRRLFVSIPEFPIETSLVNNTVLVTGANAGLGLESCRHYLALEASRLIMAVRSTEKGDAAAQGLRSQFPHAQIDVWELDMASFRSVQAFAARCNSELDRLDVAILNAGAGNTTFVRAEEGRKREMTLQVNYLATALLAVLLLPKMRPTSSSAEPGRLTVVTSDAGLGVKLRTPAPGESIVDSLDKPESFSGFGQYATSKLLATMFAARLADVVPPDQVIINATNPGATKGTEFLADLGVGLVQLLLALWLKGFGRNVADAAKIYVHASSVLGRESHGSYTEWDIRPWPVIMYGENGRKLSDRLWKETLEELSFAGADKILANFEH